MARKTIKLRDYLKVVEEYVADGDITPGHLVEVDSDEKVTVHSSDAVKPFPVMFANENEFEGQTIDDAYESGDVVQCWIPQRGDIVYGILESGENVAKFAKLISTGDGALRETDSGGENDSVVGVALEALDLSGSGAEDTHIMVLIV